MPHKDPKAAKAWRAKYRGTERCKELRAANYTKHRLAIIDRMRAHRLKKVYNITPEQYAAMLRAQHGICAICKMPPRRNRLAVDHDHKTGKVRGLLCPRCNAAIARFQDEPLNLRHAASYLERQPDFTGLLDTE